jgi:hypothetical protein
MNWRSFRRRLGCHRHRFFAGAVLRARGWWASGRGRVVEGRFFRLAAAAPLDLIYERAFLCALPRAMWPQVAARWAGCWRQAACWPVSSSSMTCRRDRRSASPAHSWTALLTPHFECIADHGECPRLDPCVQRQGTLDGVATSEL